jgi:peptidoglycan/xylan/chitin deacetylase (PgdA/CDA1 family)
VRLENVPQNLQKGKIDYTDDTFLENLMKRYIGAPSVNADDRTIGFSGREVRRLDETGCIHTDENVVFLTFDDWGHDTSINKLMYVLRKHNVNGTFFIITNNTLYNPNLLRAIAQDGNEIASHSDKHRPMVVRDEKNRQVPTQNEEEYHEDLGLAYDKLVSVTGDVVVNGKHSLTRFFRPPTLAISKMGIKALFDNGYEYIVSGWYSTEDYKAKDTEQMVKRIYGGIYERDGKIRKGSIIVMHMSEPAAYTARALDLILTANEKRADGDPLKFKVGLLGDYLKDDYCQLPYRKQAAEK